MSVEGVKKLFQRYPELEFLFHFIEKKPLKKQKLPNINIKTREVVYCYGFSCEVYETLFSWLEENRQAQLIFLEESLFSLEDWTDHELFLHPRVHLRLLFDPSEREAFAFALASDFPFPAFEAIYLEDYEKVAAPFFETLQERVVIESALHQEKIHAPYLFKNILHNFLKLEEAYWVADLEGKFKDVPAIIAGAGPSLSKEIAPLCEEALVFAGGSSIISLNHLGITPDFCIAIDPNKEEYSRLRLHTSFGAPLFYANRLNKEVMHLFNGPLGYLQTYTGGPIEAWLEEELDLPCAPVHKEIDQKALSVTTIAIALALNFGCNPIYLAGVDLAFIDRKRYIDGVAHPLQLKIEEERNTEKLSDHKIVIDGIETLVKWKMERDWISSFAKKYPDRLFYRLSFKGLPIEGILPIEIETIPFSRIKKPGGFSCKKVQVTKNKIVDKLILLYESFLKVKEHLLVLSAGYHPLAEIELLEEIAYKLLFQGEEKWFSKEEMLKLVEGYLEHFNEIEEITAGSLSRQS